VIAAGHVLIHRQIVPTVAVVGQSVRLANSVWLASANSLAPQGKLFVVSNVSTPKATTITVVRVARHAQVGSSAQAEAVHVQAH
tara:strand:- start:23084 stop:23335 length:252 start_codon:yes stop_codon:yes gene_type:complete